jgi:hypothetical protein
VLTANLGCVNRQRFRVINASAPSDPKRLLSTMVSPPPILAVGSQNTIRQLARQDESVTKLWLLIDNLGPTHFGKFFNHDGREYPW